MKNQLTISAISLEEQLTIMGGVDTAAKPKPKTPTKKTGDVTIGDGNTIIIKILCW